MSSERYVLFFGVLLTFASSTNGAQTCSLAPWSEFYEVGGSVSFEQSPDDCRLVTSLTSSMPAAAAVAHFRPAGGTTSLRLSFRIDLSDLAGQTAFQGVTVLSAVSRSAIEISGNSVANIVRLGVSGGTASRNLIVVAGCTTSTTGLCSSSSPIEAVSTIGLDIQIGTGEKGWVRWWLDQPFDQPPTGEMNGLDNAPLVNIERVALGLSSANTPFVQSFINKVITFDNISYGDDLITWRPNEIEGNAACQLGHQIIFGLGVENTTCSGSFQLPSLASGVTFTHSPHRTYWTSWPWTADAGPYFILLESVEPRMSVFLCDIPCGPAARCHAAGSPAVPLQIPLDLPAGNYSLVVKTIGAADSCAGYRLTTVGPLGR